MAIYEVKMSNGYPVTINMAESVEDAMAKAEDQENRFYQGPGDLAAKRASKLDYMHAEGEYLVRNKKVTAISATLMREVSCGLAGYQNIPA